MPATMPFGVRFFYESENNDLENVLLIEDPSKVSTFHLRITNILDDKSIEFEADDDEIDSRNYHFRLRFAAGKLLEPKNITLKSSEGDYQWELKHILEENGTDALYLCLRNQDLLLGSSESIDFSFNAVVAKEPEMRTSGDAGVSLRWKMDVTQESLALEAEEYHGQETILTVTPEPRVGGGGDYVDEQSYNLKIVKQKGKPNIPLDVKFVGSNRVLNLNDQETTLKLRITNNADPVDSESIIKFNYNTDPAQCSRLVLVLEVGEAATVPWALGTKDDINGIGVSASNPNWECSAPKAVPEQNPTRLEWTITPTSDQEFKPQDALEVDISKVKTAHPTGATKLSLRYEYVPDYQDGEFISVIEKVPLVFHDAVNGQVDYRVGIGTTQPKESLHIYAGNLRLEHTDHANNGEIQTAGTLVLRSNVDMTEDLSVKFFDQTNSTNALMVLDKNGQLGIGIQKPEAKLHVTETIKAKNVEVVETVTAKKLEGDGAVFTRMILMWSGSADDIPNGWKLCNGKNGTPDLMDKFIVGAGSEKYAGDKKTGGAETVTLTKQELPSHNHGVDDKGHSHTVDLLSVKGESDNADDRDVMLPGSNTVATNHVSSNITILNTGQGQAFDIRPPYYALCFIMKVPLPDSF